MSRILIVEKEFELRPALEFVLKPFGREVLWVTDAPQAKKTLTPEVALVIAEYGLSGKANGLDLWKECRKKLPDVPFLLMSGEPDSIFEELIRKGLECPEFLLKPFTAQDCRAVVSRLLKAQTADIQAA